MNEFDSIDFSQSVDPVETPFNQDMAGVDFSAPIDQPADAPERQGFIQRAGNRLGERNQRIANDFKEIVSGESTVPEALLNVTGELAGSLLDIGGEGFVSVGRGVSNITPDFIKDPVEEGTTELFQQVVNTDIGKEGINAMKAGIGQYREFKASNPRIARLLENTINVGLVFAPVKVKENAGPSILTKASDKAKASAQAQIKGSKDKFVQELIGPVRDLRVLKKEVQRTSEVGSGILKRSVVEPTPREKLIAKEVGKISGISPKNSVQGNFNVINAENKKLAIQLQKDVETANVSMQRQSVLQQVDDVIDEAIANNIFIVGSGVNAAEKLRLNAAKIIIKHSDDSGNISGSGLLAARKELDAVIKSQKPGVFNENTAESSIEIISRATRKAMNDILDESVTGSRAVDIKVKEELKRQSLLFSALDNMTPKAAQEANMAIIRTIQNAMKVIPVRNEAVQLLAASAGVGGLGAAAMAAPKIRTAGVIAGTLYGAYRGAKSPSLKLLTSKVLSMADEAIRTTKNPSMLKALRADRALMVELVKNTAGFGEALKPIPEEP